MPCSCTFYYHSWLLRSSWGSPVVPGLEHAPKIEKCSFWSEREEEGICNSINVHLPPPQSHPNPIMGLHCFGWKEAKLASNINPTYWNGSCEQFVGLLFEHLRNIYLITNLMQSLLGSLRIPASFAEIGVWFPLSQEQLAICKIVAPFGPGPKPRPLLFTPLRFLSHLACLFNKCLYWKNSKEAEWMIKGKTQDGLRSNAQLLGISY